MQPARDIEIPRNTEFYDPVKDIRLVWALDVCARLVCGLHVCGCWCFGENVTLSYARLVSGPTLIERGSLKILSIVAFLLERGGESL